MRHAGVGPEGVELFVDAGVGVLGADRLEEGEGHHGELDVVRLAERGQRPQLRVMIALSTYQAFRLQQGPNSIRTKYPAWLNHGRVVRQDTARNPFSP